MRTGEFTSYYKITITSFVLIVSLTLGMLAVSSGEVMAEDDIIEFACEELEAEIREIIDEEEGPIRPEDVKDIETLDISDSFIESLAGIEHFKNLSEINARFNRIEDISPLAELDRLTKINLFSNQISDISPVSEMTGIKEIDIRRNDIETIATLEGGDFYAEGALLDLRFNDIDITDFDFLYLAGNMEDEGLEVKFDPQD